MHLTPREQERLMIHMAGMLAGERKKRGLKLNYPEAIAYITSELLELARDGHSVTELMQAGRKLLTEEDVMDGVAGMITEIQLEATFPDGTKLVTVHEPIPPSKTPVSGTGIPGEVICAEGDIFLNAGKEAIELKVTNTADRPIQVGSHFHFFEVNKELKFDREAAFGRRLDIPSGTAVRFEPGESRKVALIPIGGRRIGGGLNCLTEGSMDEEKVKAAALHKAKELGFQGVGLYD